MDMFDGFVFLEEKKKSLIPILCQYDFLSALTAAFSITSWRKNRGAQESCLALNSAMVENTEWGRKTIFTPNDLEEFFQLLYPILKTTPYDDPVLPDFGEIKLNYRSKYYSVITGTGHTAPIFSALQFLEKISESACMDAYTDSLLCYSDYCIDFLKAKNTPINEDFSLHPQFESPTFDYYENVKDFMTEEKWTGLGTPLLSMLAAESNEIVRSHFFSYNDHYYPLFNPSLVIDYQTKILLTRPDRELHSIVISSLADKLASIYDSHDIKTDYTIRKPLLLDNKQPLLDNKKSFAYLEDSNLIVFLDCGNEHRIEEEISAIYKAHTEDGLSIVDLEARIPGKGYKAYHVDKECKLSIICFDEHINVDQPRIVLRGREEKRIYTAIDLMYMLMFSSEVSQIAEFDSDEKNSESQVLSWGGASDYFTVFLSEKGFISKGAIEYSNVYSEVDTSAAHIFSHYLELGGVFPFHLSSTIFADPECWNVICDDNSVYQFTRKVKALPGGALFKYDNGCSVFLSYNFFSILKESNITQSRLSLDMFRAVTEKFFIEYHQDLSAIPPLANTLVQFCCHSLSNQNPGHYVCCQKAKVSSNKLVVDFEVNSSKIASDIAEAIDRSVEYSVIGELLQPLVCLSKDSYSELFEKMELTSGQKKTLGTTAVRIDYYFNPDTYEIKETDVSELSIRKQIAKICAAAGVLPGTYERRDATEIYMSNNDYIYSPIIMEEVRKRWIEGFLQFYPPFEIGLERTCTALYAWKNNYEHLFSSEVEVLLKESGCEYAKHDVDLRREDRRGNHPTIDVLGDYDVIGLNTTQKRIFIIECKVLQPIGSVFEHSNQQKRFFTKEKFDEKFQKRIDYFSKVAMSFFANHGYDTEGFTINPYMVVNKVFSSYYKHVQFPIVTFDELKREIQL